MQRRSGLRITTMQSCVGIAVCGYCRAAWVQSGVRRWMSLTPVRARRCSNRWTRAHNWYIDYAPSSLCISVVNYFATINHHEGTESTETVNGTVEEYQFGLAEISFMNEVTAGRVIFGPDNAEPILGVTALESVGVVIDPANRTLKRL